MKDVSPTAFLRTHFRSNILVLYQKQLDFFLFSRVLNANAGYSSFSKHLN